MPNFSRLASDIHRCFPGPGVERDSNFGFGLRISEYPRGATKARGEGVTKQEVRAKIAEWGVELQSIGRRYHIRSTNKQDDRSARRIAILVCESFLRCFSVPADKSWGKAVHFAGFIQSDVYRQAKQLNLSCAEIEEEERIKEMGRKGQGFDPLKLHPDTGGHNPGIMQIVFDNLLKHQESEENGPPKRKVAGRKVLPGILLPREAVSSRIVDK